MISFTSTETESGSVILCNPMDYIESMKSPGQITGVSSLSLLQGIFSTQGLNPCLPHCRWILYQLSHKGGPRILEWVAYPFSSESSQHRNRMGVYCIAGGFFTNWAIREDPSEEIDIKTRESEGEVTQLCPTLCDPMDCSLPGSFVHGIFQARILEWVAISFSRRSSPLRDQTRVSCIVDRCFIIWATREVTLNPDLIKSQDTYFRVDVYTSQDGGKMFYCIFLERKEIKDNLEKNWNLHCF